MQQLSGQDASFLYMETRNAPMHIGGFSIYDPSTAPGPVTFRSILETIDSRIHLARVFRQKLVRVPFDLDHPYWINDPDFDLEFHVRHIALPKPGDWRQLCIQAARIHARELDLSRPLWEMYVIEGLDNVDGLPKGCFALLSKTHHAAIDGVSGMDMTSAIHDLTPDGGEVPPAEPFVPEREPDLATLLARTTFNNVRKPAHFARVIRRTMPTFAGVQGRVERKELSAPPTGAPRTRFNGTVTPHRVADSVTFSLDDMRAAKAAVPGATINDAVLATVGGALRTYLTSKKELPDVSLVAMAPISVRTESERGTAGNQVSAMFVQLGTHIAGAGERLLAVRENTHSQKEYMSALGARSLTELSQFLPGSLFGLAARASARFGLANRGSPMVNTLVSNVPGPQQPLYFAGAELLKMYGLGPVSEAMGLIHAIPSYRGEIVISVTACREMMPDPAFYADCLRESFDELISATYG